MLGKLARWLRILGYDTAYDPFAEDDALLRLAEGEERLLLTRDRPLAERAPGGTCILVEHGDLDGQLQQLVREAGIDLDRTPFTRCLVCNEPIRDVSADEVRSDVPPYVAAHHDRFCQCPACGRIYWQGTHMHRMNERLAAIRQKIRH